MKLLSLFAGVVIAGSVGAAELEGLDCDTSVTSGATGFFRLEQDAKGTWHFVTPGGHGFFLAANNGPARMTGDACPALGYSPYKRTLERKYGKDVARWAAEASGRLKEWRFNAISSWDPPVKGLVGGGLASVRVIQLGKSYARDTPNNDSNLLDNVTFKGRFPNVFRDDFADHCRRMAARFCAKERDNPWIVGWYTDNEITWRGAVKQDANGMSGDAHLGTGMYDAVSQLPPEHSGRRALDAFLAEKGLRVGDAGVSVKVKQDFLTLVAERYYRIATSAIRAAAPHHLVLGCRFAGFRSTPDIAWEEGGKWNDAMSVNSYPPADLTNGYVKVGFTDDRRPISAKLREVYRKCRRPILLTEWSYPAKDTKCPCKVGAGQRVPTQRERAAASALFARTLISEPEVVGYSYFRWADQPAPGRWKMTGGEDCNYGLVNEEDEPYELLTEAFKKVHGEMYDLRRRIGTEHPAVRPASTVPYPRFKTYSKVRGGLWWKPRHESKLAEIAAGGGAYDLVLLGDSITHYWEDKPYAQKSWSALTNACRTLNLGFAGDKTEHVLWRIDNGELDGYRAKRIVLMIGTNNSTADTTRPWETALGVRAILDRIRAKQPQAQVVLTAIFPRGRGEDDAQHAAARRRNDETNAILHRFADGKRVVWMDFNARLTAPNGWTSKEMFPDRIHPSEEGYRIWSEELKNGPSADDPAIASETFAGNWQDADAPRSPLEKPGWTLTFNDDFDGVHLKDRNWYQSYRAGRKDWFRRMGIPSRFQDPDANYVIEDGILKLRIDRDKPLRPEPKAAAVSSIQTSDYRVGKTTNDIQRLDKFAQKYGWWEIRCRMPKGDGLHAAFWLTHADPLSQEYTLDNRRRGDLYPPGTRGKDSTVEIDIFEALGRYDKRLDLTVLFPNNCYREGHFWNHDELPFDWSKHFHTYALEWEEGQLTWYVDGQKYWRYRGPTPQKEMMILLGMYQLGANPKFAPWLKPTPDNLPYPLDFEIDYVRVYSRKTTARHK